MNNSTPLTTGVARDGRHVEGIRNRLRSGILRGEITAETLGSQVRLAEFLGVSRTPLREAVRMLQEEGLIVSEPNRRLRIAHVSVHDLEELYFIRIALDDSLIRVTVPLLERKDHAELEGLLASMNHYLEEGDLDGLEEPHRAFHMRLVAGVGNRPSELSGQLYDHALRYRRMYPHADREIFQREHRLILDAVEQGDADEAAVILALHGARVVVGVASNLAPGHSLPKIEALLALRGIDIHDAQVTPPG